MSEVRQAALEASLQAQQYYSDAQETESWMKEKEPLVSSGDYGKDEDSAQVSVDEREGVCVATYIMYSPSLPPLHSLC